GIFLPTPVATASRATRRVRRRSLLCHIDDGTAAAELVLTNRRFLRARSIFSVLGQQHGKPARVDCISVPGGAARGRRGAEPLVACGLYRVAGAAGCCLGIAMAACENCSGGLCPPAVTDRRYSFSHASVLGRGRFRAVWIDAGGNESHRRQSRIGAISLDSPAG